MEEYEFVNLHIERPDETGPTYKIHGLPQGADFRRRSDYEEVWASSLKVEGVAFATSGAEFGEHQTIIRVGQETEGGMANITFHPME